jgi:ubiquinone/menaquinone biosynthesis C-methylase UbiE
VTYVCGHSARELERLEAQGAFFADISRRSLEAAGVVRGMRVLDIGCGVGDLTFLAADLVGREGSVIGIDRATEAIEIADARRRARSLEHVRFTVAEADTLHGVDTVDALVGRFVLMHQADPGHTLRHAASFVRTGGLVSIIESHLAGSVAAVHSHPFSPAYDRVIRSIVQILEAAGAHVDMGPRLHETFVEAGLPAPRLSFEARVDGGPDAATCSYMCDSLRSMLPVGQRCGATPLSMSDVDALEAQLKTELVAGRGVLISPIVVSAACRVTAARS